MSGRAKKVVSRVQRATDRLGRDWRKQFGRTSPLGNIAIPGKIQRAGTVFPNRFSKQGKKNRKVAADFLRIQRKITRKQEDPKARGIRSLGT